MGNTSSTGRTPTKVTKCIATGVSQFPTDESPITTGCQRSIVSTSSSTTSDTSYDDSFNRTNPSLPIPIPHAERRLEARNARLANLMFLLDEELPQGFDESITELIQASPVDSWEDVAYLLDETYLEYKVNMAAKKAVEKKLPRSKGRRTMQE